jgi:septal ring factor EnvC (AmiA/AmiB activator)
MTLPNESWLALNRERDELRAEVERQRAMIETLDETLVEQQKNCVALEVEVERLRSALEAEHPADPLHQAIRPNCPTCEVPF